MMPFCVTLDFISTYDYAINFSIAAMMMMTRASIAFDGDGELC